MNDNRSDFASAEAPQHKLSLEVGISSAGHEIRAKNIRKTSRVQAELFEYRCGPGDDQPSRTVEHFDADVVESAGKCYARVSGYRTVTFRENVEAEVFEALRHGPAMMAMADD